MSDPGSTMADPNWGKPQSDSRTWIEPILVVSIMIGSCYITRRRNYTIRPPPSGDTSILNHMKLEPSDEQELADMYEENDPFFVNAPSSTEHLKKERRCCGAAFRTPNSSRFANHWHSRFIQKFPFLVEMFYWAVNYTVYISAKGSSELIFSTNGIWELAENHGKQVLWFEHDSIFRLLFPLTEVGVQQWFMNGHQDLLTLLNRAYSLVHIPATVSFLGWYYYAAPTHEQFASIRRMMTLTNFLSFFIFTAWPCMPPRLLPKEFGFHDTVRQDDAESVWASGKFFNQLAAFPSLHFGYAFCVGVTFLYHSGVLRQRRGPREKRVSKLKQALLIVFGVLYPGFVLSIIVATANHYWADALAASFVVGFAFLCNKIFLVFLPLEDWFLWCTRLEKPIPTTGGQGR